ncbi:MAG TPA: glycosyltransferase family 4 protein [Candidatus Krumholzibacteria bacterium]
MSLHVSMLVPGLAKGGMTRAYSLASALRVLGARVDIVGALARNEEVYPQPPAGIDVIPVPPSPMARRAYAMQRAARGDILYAIKPRVTSFGVGLWCRRRRPLLLDVDDRETQFRAEYDATHAVSWRRRARRQIKRARNPDDASYTRWMEELTGRAAVITANTRLLCEEFNAVLVPSAKDTTLFDPARFDAEECRRTLGLDGQRVIMFPGTPRAHKGVEDALDALDLLGWPDARLVIVGGREVGHVYARSLRARYERWLVHLPRFAAEEMPGVVAAAHVVVVPQRDTPVARAQFPIKITDAMAMAKPIISTRVGDIPHALDGAAYLVAPSSPKEIAAALEAIFADPREAARLGAEARRRCEERFSTAAVAGIMRGILEGMR